MTSAVNTEIAAARELPKKWYERYRILEPVLLKTFAENGSGGDCYRAFH